MPVCSHAAATMLCLGMSLCVQETWIGADTIFAARSAHYFVQVLCCYYAIMTSPNFFSTVMFPLLSLSFVSGGAGRQPSRCQTASCQWCRREQARYRWVKDQFGHKNASKVWPKLTSKVWPKDWDWIKRYPFLDQVDPFACSSCQWSSKHRKVR